MALTITDTILTFAEIEEIGRGGVGVVMRAIDPQLGAEFALKKVPKNFYGNNPNEYFEEAQKLYITQHPNVVDVRYACQSPTHICMAMPFYRLGSILQLVESRFLTTDEIIAYSLQFLSGLNHVHAKGLLHFDVKLGNIMRSNTDQALLSDFGFAQRIIRYGFAEHQGTTKAYAPPEYFSQVQWHNIKFDIWQAGMAILEMCIGSVALGNQRPAPLFVNGIFDHQPLYDEIEAGNHPKLNQFYCHTPIAIRNVIKKALAFDPDDRYNTVNQMINDLGRIAGGNMWQFTTDYAGNERWEKPGYVVTAQKINNRWTTSAIKNRRKLEFCRSNLTEGAKNQLMYRCLNTIW